MAAFRRHGPPAAILGNQARHAEARTRADDGPHAIVPGAAAHLAQGLRRRRHHGQGVEVVHNLHGAAEQSLQLGRIELQLGMLGHRRPAPYRRAGHGQASGIQPAGLQGVSRRGQQIGGAGEVSGGEFHMPCHPAPTT